jgi:hypothetical protein
MRLTDIFLLIIISILGTLGISQVIPSEKINLISDELFILYSYLRKGSNILKKKVEDKIKIIQIFNNIESKIIQTLIKNQDVKTLK